MIVCGAVHLHQKSAVGFISLVFRQIGLYSAQVIATAVKEDKGRESTYRRFNILRRIREGKCCQIHYGTLMLLRRNLFSHNGAGIAFLVP